MTDAPETPTYELGRTPAERELFWRLAPDALWIDGAPCAFARPEEGATRRFVLVGERRPASGEAASAPGGGQPEGLRPLGEGASERPPMLALRRPPGWREGWGLRLLLVRPDGAVGTSLLLTLEDPVLRLEPLGEGWRLAVEPWVQSTWAAPAPPLPGSAAVPLGDPTWQRASRQSSVGAWSEDVPESRRGWGLPTRAEPAPFVELDLGQILYVDAVRVHWSDEVGPRGAVELNLYPRLGPGGAPWFADRAWHETVELRPGPWVEARPQALGRFLRVTLHPEGGPAPLALGGIEARACALTGATLLGSLERAFTLFGARPLFSCRERLPDGGLGPYRRWTPYRAVWEHARRLAAGLRERLQDAPRGPGARVFVGLCAPNQPEWACADLACLFDAFVVVPLPATDPAERLQVLIERAGVSAVFAGREQLPRLQEVQARVPTLETLIELPPLDRSDAPEPLPGALAYGALVEEGDALVEGFVPAARDPDDLHTVLFSSGSTGVPKGAMRSYAASNALLTAFGVSEPAVHLSFQPLSHFSERVYLPSLLVHGARIGFSSGGERLYEEFALLEPTAIGGPPRVFEVLFERYREDLARLQAEAPDADLEALEEQALAGLRGVFGGRLQSVSAGSAPPSRALMAFLGRLFDFCRVGEGYGSTECATITVDDQVHSGVDLRLVDVPELGYRTTDDPPRGEILVRTPHMVSGYLGDDAATAAGFDADGYFRTGDLGERQPDGRVRVIGRRTSVVKLAQGEFVSPERIEDALSASALVGELCVHADSLQASVVALAVPARGPLAQALGCAEEDVARLSDAQAAARVLADLRQVGRAAGLLPFELPAAVHLELEPLSVERGLRTSSNKLDRRAIAARYAEVFAALYAGARPSAGVLELVRAAAAEVLGDMDPDADFAARLGVDSLSGVELVTAVSQRLGREVPLSAWHGASSLAELARRIQVQAGVGAAQDAEAGAAAEAQADLARPLQLEDGALAQAPPHPPLRVLLTGATGFLGAHLLEALLARGLEVRCLVRAQDDAAAAARLAAAAARWGLACDPGRAQALAGDLALPRLGWDAPRWAAQAEELDAILHAGAQVNWLMLYGQLRRVNVLGTDALLELAGGGRGAALHLVSTISTAPADADEDGALAPEVALRSSGYGLSKWVAEQRARQAAARGLALTVHRPAMITGHSTRGVANPDDFVNRALRTFLQLGVGLDLEDARCDLTPVDWVAEAIVALVLGEPAAGQVSHLNRYPESPSWRALSQALGVRPLPYPALRQALLEAGDAAPLAPLRGFFPPEGFRLRMGPWPSRRTRARLQALWVPEPPPGLELVEVYRRLWSGA